MHRTIGYLSKRVVHVRPGEGRKVLLTFFYFLTIMSAYYVIKPVSRSLVLGELGSRMVPYMDLICAVVMGPVVTLFARLVDRMHKSHLVSLAFWSIIGLMVLFWKMLAWPMPWIAGAFYVWVSIFSVLVVTLFWLVANDLYRPRDAKRLFGFIGSGGILGGIAGSSIAAMGAHVVGTKQLLLCSAGLMLLCWLVVQRLWHFLPESVLSEEGMRKVARRETFLSSPIDFTRLLVHSRYLLLLIVLVGLNKLVATLTYYRFNPFIEQAFPSQDARTAFMGMFLGAVNAAAFIIQFFFTSWILRRGGLSMALLALPVGLLAGTTGLLILPMLWLAAGTELYDGSLNYSLQQTAKEVLYLPIDRSIRYKVKPFIDMVVFRFGKGLAAVMGIVLLSVWKLPPSVLSAIAIPLLVVWLIVAIWLRREYISTIRTMLQARAAARRGVDGAEGSSAFPETVECRGGELAEPFVSLTHGPSSTRKLTLVDQLVSGGKGASAAKDLLIELRDYEASFQGQLGSDRMVPQLKAIVNRSQEPMPKRREALRLLARVADQETVDYLIGLIMVESEAVLRQEAVRGLVSLRLRGTRFEFHLPSIHRQLAIEVANYQRILHVALIYRQHYRGRLAPDDTVLALLRVLLEESVEQIFQFLMLLYHPQDIHLIYEQLRAPDSYTRSDAIELLDNLVDPALRQILLPILDEDRFLARLEEEPQVSPEPTVAYRLLQEAIWDHNCWLSVTTLCAIGRLRLTTLRPELEKASHHHRSLIATAAKVALHLAAHP